MSTATAQKASKKARKQTGQKAPTASDVLESVITLTDFDSRHDAVNHVLKGVKLLGLVSKNGRRYKNKAVSAFTKLAEGVSVCINHPDRDRLTQPRAWQDRWGVIRKAMTVTEGAEGDLHYNPDHPLTAAILYDLKNGAGGGLSLNGRLVSSQGPDGVDVVEDVTILRSIDLVLNPATTRDLFESESEELTLLDQVTMLTHRTDLNEADLRAELAQVLESSKPAEDGAKPDDATPEDEDDETTPEDEAKTDSDLATAAALESVTEVMTKIISRLDAVEQRNAADDFCRDHGGSLAALTASQRQELTDATEQEREEIWSGWTPAKRGQKRPPVEGIDQTESDEEPDDDDDDEVSDLGSTPLGPRKV